MSKINPWTGTLRPFRACLPFVIVVGFGLPAYALPKIDNLDMDQVSVRELMQLETEHALKLARSRSAGSGQTMNRPERTARNMTGQPRLAAIYGVGKQLMAEVVVDHVIYLYRHGQALPVGVAPGDDVLVLQKINANCVGLKNAESTHHLCLRPAQWAEK